MFSTTFLTAFTATTLFSSIALADYSPQYSECTSFTPFQSYGCFDNTAGAALAFSPMSLLNFQSMTIEICTAACKANGFRYAGVASCGSCSCGSAIQTSQLDSSQCCYPCTGNQAEICGGNNALSIYIDPMYQWPVPAPSTAVAGYVSLGCYSEVAGYALNLPQNDLSNSNPAVVTPELCIARCANIGAAYAAVENGVQCFCGGSMAPLSVPVASSQCNVPCTAPNTANEICGGSNALNVFYNSALDTCQPCASSPPIVLSTTTVTTFGGSTGFTTTTTAGGVVSVIVDVPTTSTTTITTTSGLTGFTTTTTAGNGVTVIVDIPSTSTTTVTTTYGLTGLTYTTTGPNHQVTVVVDVPSTKNAPPQPTPPSPPPPPPPPSPPATCISKCGNYCQPPLPTFTSPSGCSTCATTCWAQLSTCFAQAGLGANILCSGIAAKCALYQSYCQSSRCLFGQCSKNDCDSNWTSLPNKGAPSPTCRPSTIAPAPTPTNNLCVIPNAYRSPVGGYSAPCVTCNNVQSDFQSGNCFKLFNFQKASYCPSYSRNSISAACQNACQLQYDNCKNQYATTCTKPRMGRRNPNAAPVQGLEERSLFPISIFSGIWGGLTSWFGSSQGSWVNTVSSGNWVYPWINGGSSDSYNTALNNCQSQKMACIAANQQLSNNNNCQRFGSQ